MVSQPQQLKARPSRAQLRTKGGVTRQRTARQRPFNLSFLGTQPVTCKRFVLRQVQNAETSEHTPAAAVAKTVLQPEQQAQAVEQQPAPLTSGLLSVCSVSIPAWDQRRRLRSFAKRPRGTGRSTQLRSFALHALLPVPPAPTITQAVPQQSDTPAATPASVRSPNSGCNLSDGQHSAHLLQSPMPTGKTPASRATPGIFTVLGLGATPGLSSSPFRFPAMPATTPASTMSAPRTAAPAMPTHVSAGYSLQTAHTTPMEGVPERTHLATAMRAIYLPSTTRKPGHVATCHWLTPIEGVLETRLVVSHSLQQSPAQPMWPRPSPRSAVAMTPMEGVPERAMLPTATPSRFRLSGLARVLLTSGSGPDSSGSGSGGTAMAAAATSRDGVLQPVAVTQAAAPAADQVTTSPQGQHCEAQVQTTAGLAVRWHAVMAGRASLTPLLLDSHGRDEGNGMLSLNSTPAAMQPLDALSLPPSLQGTPLPVAQASGASVSLQLPGAGTGGDSPGLLADSPVLGRGGARGGDSVPRLWPGNMTPGLRGPGSYGDDGAGELVAGGHMDAQALGDGDSGPEDWGGASSSESEPEAEQGRQEDGGTGGGRSVRRAKEGHRQDAVGCAPGGSGGASSSQGRVPQGSAGGVGSGASQQLPGSLGSTGGREEERREGQEHLEDSSEEAPEQDVQGEEEEEQQAEERMRPQLPAAQRAMGRVTKRSAAASHSTDMKNRRKSLAGAGLKEDENGLRRSSRARIKPLEYWRNEHKVYGRNHRTLPTVVGIETRTPNAAWPAYSTGHETKKKMRARTRAALHDGSPKAAAAAKKPGQRVQDWEDDE